MEKKPFRILEEHLKFNFIEIKIFKKQKVFSYSLSTSIGDGGTSTPGIGSYLSFYEAKNAALRCVLHHHKSAKQKSLLKKFKVMEDLDQPNLFGE